VVAEAVVVVVHPRRQAGRGLVRIRAFRLAGPDPAAIQVADELAEAPTRTLCSLSASRVETPEKSRRSRNQHTRRAVWKHSRTGR
jgi:hypothetical protein